MQLPQNNSGDKNDKENLDELDVVVGDQTAAETVASVTNSTLSSTMQEPDFSEFMWMANEDLEAFDRKVISELDEHLGINSGAVLEEEEEEFLQRMLDEEEERDTVYFASRRSRVLFRESDGNMKELSSRMHRMNVTDGIAAHSTLNPFAAEFIPSQGLQNPNLMAPTITLMAQANSCPMLNQMYASNIGTSLHSSAISSMQQHLPPPPLQDQTVMWRQHSPQISPRFNGPVHAQINGHDALRNLYGNAPNMPVYLSNVPVFPVMNGGEFIRPPQNQFHHPENDRSTVDEGYEDN